MTIADPERDSEHAWYEHFRVPGGYSVGNVLLQIKNYAYVVFDKLDADKDGFISRTELENALELVKNDWQQTSFIRFLITRMSDIEKAYTEEWNAESEGISRADIQEYFKKLKV